MGLPPEALVHLKAAALLPELEVHGGHQVGRDFVGHILCCDHHSGRALLQSTEQIGPEIHELALPSGLQTLPLEEGSTAMATPEGRSAGAAVTPVGQARAEGFRAGAPIELAQSRGLQQLAGVHGGDAVDAANLCKGQPLGG